MAAGLDRFGCGYPLVRCPRVPARSELSPEPANVSRHRLPDHEHGPAEHAPLLHLVAEALQLGDQEPCRPPSLRRLDRHSHSRDHTHRTRVLMLALAVQAVCPHQRGQVLARLDGWQPRPRRSRWRSSAAGGPPKARLQPHQVSGCHAPTWGITRIWHVNGTAGAAAESSIAPGGRPADAQGTRPGPLAGPQPGRKCGTRQ
jgi:hypothetical protein